MLSLISPSQKSSLSACVWSHRCIPPSNVIYVWALQSVGSVITRLSFSNIHTSSCVTELQTLTQLIFEALQSVTLTVILHRLTSMTFTFCMTELLTGWGARTKFSSNLKVFQEVKTARIRLNSKLKAL